MFYNTETEHYWRLTSSKR